MFTHAAALRIVDTDRAGLAAFIRHGNHCACDAVRCDGVVVHQCGGFDGPHEVASYTVLRESDGAVVESLSLWRPERAEHLADVAIACAAEDAEPLGDKRVRLDPHPEGTCRACN